MKLRLIHHFRIPLPPPLPQQSLVPRFLLLAIRQLVQIASFGAAGYDERGAGFAQGFVGCEDGFEGGGWWGLGEAGEEGAEGGAVFEGLGGALGSVWDGGCK